MFGAMVSELTSGSVRADENVSQSRKAAATDA